MLQVKVLLGISGRGSLYPEIVSAIPTASHMSGVSTIEFL